MRPILVLFGLFAFAASAVFVASADSQPAGSGDYVVFIEDEQSTEGIGTFTVMTGPDHPDGEGQEVLLNRDGPGDADTSYLTVRSYTTGVDYVQTTSDVFSANIVYPLDPFGVVIPLPGGAGYTTSYDVSEYDRLHIESAVSAEGEEASIAATVRNDGDSTAAVGVRYLFDVAPGGDDGPLLETPSDPAGIATSAAFAPAPDAVNVVPNDAPDDMAFSVTTGSGTPELAFAAWPGAFDSAFSVGTDGADIATAGGINDSALAYTFGATPETAITLAPGEEVTVALTISAPVDLPPGCEPDCPTPTPTPAQPTPTPALPTATPAMTPAELPHTGGRRR